MAVIAWLFVWDNNYIGVNWFLIILFFFFVKINVFYCTQIFLIISKFKDLEFPNDRHKSMNAIVVAPQITSSCKRLLLRVLASKSDDDVKLHSNRFNSDKFSGTNIQHYILRIGSW